MKYFKIFLICILLSVGFVSSFAFFPKERSPENIVEELEKGIESAEEKGEYKCCIKPSCKMCYIGNWHFEKGNCYCDDMIAQGKMDKVCPECKSGLEDNVCKSNSEK
ncbi:MAG: hypothetical protein ACQER9_00585 [Nanobdellota archaeon]